MIAFLLTGVMVFTMVDSFSLIGYSSPGRVSLRPSSTILLATLNSNNSYNISGFSASGDSNDNPPVKTYGNTAAAAAGMHDLMDAEEAMKDFFSTREDWIPLFRNMAMSSDISTTTSCPASRFLSSTEAAAVPSSSTSSSSESSSFVFDETTRPWRRLHAIPHREQDRAVLSRFLDATHQSLLDIPVTDTSCHKTAVEDANDVQFLEEGRRMLAINRFHVLHQVQTGSLDGYDQLFATCWSELMELTIAAEEHTGSIILLPNYSDQITDLWRFADINLLRPLEWLGVHHHFEVASLQRGSPAIRLLYKLSDLPSNSDND